MADRTSAVWTVDVQGSADRAFAYLADMSRHGEWSPKSFRVEGLSPGPVTPGTTFVSYGSIPGDKDHRNEVEVTEVVAPSKLAFRSKEPKGDIFVNSFTLTSTGESSCRIEREMDMPTPKGVMGVIFPFFLRAYIRPTVQKGMNNLKERIEMAPPSGT